MSARRAEILDGAQRSFARWGFDGATVPRLEEEVGLSHGAIFNHFENKLDLFLELAIREHERWDRIWREDGFEALARAIVEEDPTWIGVLLEFEQRLRTDPELRQRAKAQLDRGESVEHAWLERERAAGRVRKDLPANVILGFLHLLLEGLALARTAPDAKIDVEPILALARRAISPP
jgi:TetR/AcrR family transcriptional regulator, transcriptional repressor of aconitase